MFCLLAALLLRSFREFSLGVTQLLDDLLGKEVPKRSGKTFGGGGTPPRAGRQAREGEDASPKRETEACAQRARFRGPPGLPPLSGSWQEAMRRSFQKAQEFCEEARARAGTTEGPRGSRRLGPAWGSAVRGTEIHGPRRPGGGRSQEAESSQCRVHGFL